MSREAAYAAVLELAGADAFVLTSEPAVQHASAVRLYTHRLIPQRPIVCVVCPPEPPVVVACVLEEDQLAAEHPGLAVRGFREFGDEPWERVAAVLAANGARRVVVEDVIPAAWLAALHDQLPEASLVVSYDLPLEPRIVKDKGEQRLLGEASRIAERALAAGAELVLPGRSEREVADAIAAAFQELAPGAGEVQGTCVAPQNNRSMHHASGPDVLPEVGPVRLGVLGRIEGYWVLITRMLVLGEDDPFEEAYPRYLRVYEETMTELVVGADPRGLYRRCGQRVAALGFELTTLKIGHGTGLDFRERPWLSPLDDMPLGSGMVLAFDYGLEGDDGTVLHLEDRVLVTAEGPSRLSSAWDLADLRGGFRTLR